MCGPGKHEKHMTEKHTFKYTKAHVYILCHKHNFQPYSKAMLLHLQSAQPDHQLGSTCLSSWVSFLRHNPSSGGFLPRSGLVGLSDWAEISLWHMQATGTRGCLFVLLQVPVWLMSYYWVTLWDLLNISTYPRLCFDSWGNNARLLLTPSYICK